MITVTQSVLEEARILFESCGVQGREGTAMIAARHGFADQLVVPAQVATPAPRCSVAVTETGKRQLAVALPLDHHYVARIHSHPGLAFHSQTDDRNPALTFEGALSIVVPFFGLGLRAGLHACAVHVLRAGRWQRAVSSADIDRLITIR